MKWTLVLAAALLVPSVAHAQGADELGICYVNAGCVSGDEFEYVTFQQCADDHGGSWFGDNEDVCLPVYPL